MSNRIDRTLAPKFKGAKINVDWDEVHRRKYRRARQIKIAIRITLIIAAVAAISVLYHGQSRCEATHGSGSIHCVD